MWLASGKTEQCLATRVQVVLFASEGKSVKEIGSIIGLSWQRSLGWRRRFLAKNDGLKDV